MGRLLSNEDTIHFENMIYLPMIVKILHKDRELIDSMPFKLKRPYQSIIDDAIKCVEKEFTGTKIYMKKRNYKIFKGKKDDLFTEYIFYHNGYEDHRKYLHYHLRNRTTELIGTYFAQGISENPLP